MATWIKQRITASAISAAVVIAILQILVPWFFDLLFSALLIGLIALVGYASKGQPK
jgi:hypothetical protein